MVKTSYSGYGHPPCKFASKARRKWTNYEATWPWPCRAPKANPSTGHDEDCDQQDARAQGSKIQILGSTKGVSMGNLPSNMEPMSWGVEGAGRLYIYIYHLYIIYISSIYHLYIIYIILLPPKNALLGGMVMIWHRGSMQHQSGGINGIDFFCGHPSHTWWSKHHGMIFVWIMIIPISWCYTNDEDHPMDNAMISSWLSHDVEDVRRSWLYQYPGWCLSFPTMGTPMAQPAHTWIPVIPPKWGKILRKW